MNLIMLGKYYRHPVFPKVIARPGSMVNQLGEDRVIWDLVNLENQDKGWVRQESVTLARFAEMFPDGPYMMIPDDCQPVVGQAIVTIEAVDKRISELGSLIEGQRKILGDELDDEKYAVNQDRFPKWIMEKLRWLEYEHHTGLPRQVCQELHDTAYSLCEELVPETPAGVTPYVSAVDQLLIGLQRLIDAKDALVRVAVHMEQQNGS